MEIPIHWTLPKKFSLSRSFAECGLILVEKKRMGSLFLYEASCAKFFGNVQSDFGAGN